ncbi:MAG: hypothetical protein HYZ53_26590, partial [Planctomycetes bacterium]|nr:hypothetical protein [Planctomycetota bacterium]
AVPAHFPFWLVLLLLPWLVLALQERNRLSDTVVLWLVAFYGTSEAFRLAGGLRAALWESMDVGVLAHLPVSDEEVFLLHCGRSLRSSGWAFYNLLAAHLWLGWNASLLELRWIGPALAVVQWLLALTVALALVSHRRRWPLSRIGWALLGVGLVPLLPGISPYVGGEWSGAALLAMPAGWMTWMFGACQAGGGMLALMPLVPAAVLLAALPGLFRRLRAGYRVLEIAPVQHEPAEPSLEHGIDSVLAVLSEHDPEMVENPKLKPIARALLVNELPAEVRRSIEGGGFLRAADWSGAGALEQWTQRRFSERDRRVADFLCQEQPDLTHRFRVCVAWTAALSLLAILPVHLDVRSSADTPVAGLIGGLALYALWAVFPGLRLTLVGSHSSPLYAGFPLGYHEMARVVLKVSLGQCLAWSPLAVVQAMAVARLYDLPLAEGAAVGVRGALLVLAAQPILFVARLSKGTNDTKLHGCLHGCGVLLVVGLVGPSLMAGFAMTLYGQGGTWVPGLALWLAGSVAVYALYGVALHQTPVDLMRPSEENESWVGFPNLFTALPTAPRRAR